MLQAARYASFCKDLIHEIGDDDNGQELAGLFRELHDKFVALSYEQSKTVDTMGVLVDLGSKAGIIRPGYANEMQDAMFEGRAYR